MENYTNVFRKHETQKLNEEFEAIFNMDFCHFYDPNGLIVDDKIWIDIVKFGEYLDEIFCYSKEGKTMFDLILEEYGYKGHDLIMRLLPDKKGGKFSEEFQWYLISQEKGWEQFDM